VNGSIRGPKDSTVYLRDLASGRTVAALAGHKDDVMVVRFTPDGKQIVSASRDKTIRIWEADSKTMIRTLSGHSEGVSALAISPDGRFAAVTHSGWHAKGFDLVDLEHGTHLQNVRLEETWLGITFIDGGKTLAVAAGHSNRVLLFPMTDGRAGSADTIIVGPRWSAGGQYPQGKTIDYGPGAIWVTGVSADDSKQRLYVTSRLDSALNVCDTRERKLVQRVPLGAVPYTCLVSRERPDTLEPECFDAVGTASVVPVRLFIEERPFYISASAACINGQA